MKKPKLPPTTNNNKKPGFKLDLSKCNLLPQSATISPNIKLDPPGLLDITAPNLNPAFITPVNN